MKGQKQLYNRMVNSIAPSVFGHEEVKRGVLLMLFGGVNKETHKDKIKLRGDLNVLQLRCRWLKSIHTRLSRFALSVILAPRKVSS